MCIQCLGNIFEDGIADEIVESTSEKFEPYAKSKKERKKPLDNLLYCDSGDKQLNAKCESSSKLFVNFIKKFNYGFHPICRCDSCQILSNSILAFDGKLICEDCYSKKDKQKEYVTLGQAIDKLLSGDWKRAAFDEPEWVEYYKFISISKDPIFIFTDGRGLDCLNEEIGLSKSNKYAKHKKWFKVECL